MFPFKLFKSSKKRDRKREGKKKIHPCSLLLREAGHHLNQWSRLVAPRDSTLEIYEALVHQGDLQPSAAQREIAKLCNSSLHHYVEERKKMMLLIDGIEEGSQKARDRMGSSGGGNGVGVESIRQWVRNHTALKGGGVRWWTKSPFSSSLSLSEPELLPSDEPRQGMYLWGGVGIGKTMLMDLCELTLTPSVPKRRSHLHSFVTDLHNRLHKVHCERMKLSVLQRRARRYVDPIEEVASDIVSETPILCFDEFQTFDIASASLLVSFFTFAFKKGMFLISTSNKPPDELCKIHSVFDDFVPLLASSCIVIPCENMLDYRSVKEISGSAHRCVFLHPNEHSSEEELWELVSEGFLLAKNFAPWERDVILQCYRHPVKIPICRGGVAAFDFIQLCGYYCNFGPADIQLISKTFHTVIVLNIPQLTTVYRDVIKRFIILIDELYQHRVKLLFTSTVPWNELLEFPKEWLKPSTDTEPQEQEYPRPFYFDTDDFTEGDDERTSNTFHFYDKMRMEERLSFERVASRLKEMGSLEYLLAESNEYMIEDFDVSVYRRRYEARQVMDGKSSYFLQS